MMGARSVPSGLRGTQKQLRERITASLAHPNARRPRAVFEELNPDRDFSPILSSKPRKVRRAAVLIPILLRPSSPTVLFTVRARTMPSHAGEISLPGGGLKGEEAFPHGTALREAEEEVGLSPLSIDIVGTLGAHTSGLGYVVTPVIGFVSHVGDIVPCPREVAEPFEVPLDHLMDLSQHTIVDREARGQVYRMWAVPCRDLCNTDRFIWGLTAAIMRSFAEALASRA